MLTQSAPAIIQALTGVLPTAAVQQLVQALGNCSQPLTHRGPVNFSPSEPRQAGPGYVVGGRWNPQSPDLSDLLSRITDLLGADVDVPGWGGPGGTNNYNYGGDNFSFPINQEFNVNTYQGGQNVYNGGDTYSNNTYSNSSYSTNVNASNVNTTNINTTTINNFPVQGGGGGFWGGAPVGFPFQPPPAPRQQLALNRGQIGSFLTGKGRYKKAKASGTASITPVTGATFDPDTCTVSLTYGSAVTVVTGIGHDDEDVAGLTESPATAVISGTLI